MIFESHPIPGETYLWSYGIALALSLILTLILVKTISKENWLTHFLNKLPISTGKPVSPFGGVPVILSFFAVLWFFYLAGWVHQENLRLFQVITLGVGLMTVLGLYDDIYHCPPSIKLFFQIAIAMILYFAGFQIERIGGMIEFGPFSILLTILWITGITNSINLIDGIDGLASGLVFLSCMTLTFVYLEREIVEASFLAVILAGSVLGFFIFNFPPAKIILGDTGSLPLGLLVALIALVLSELLGLPILDAVASIIISIILAVTAGFLAYECKGLLTGEGAGEEVVSGIKQIINESSGISHVNEVLTLHLGPQDILLNISLDFKDNLSSSQVEEAISQLEHKIKKMFPEVRRVFIEAQGWEARRR